MMRITPILLAALLAGCDWMPGKPTKPEVERGDAHAVTSFDTLWTTHCSGCHGAGGRFGAARPMNDPLYLSLADDAYLTRVTRDGVADTLMPPFSQDNGGPITDAQITIIVDGIRETWGHDTPHATGAPSLDGGPGTASAGEGVYASHCAQCHGPGGRGGDAAGSIVDPSFLALTSDQALRSAVICGRLDLGMPTWNGSTRGVPSPARTATDPLTATQVADLVAWIASHRVPYPGQPYPMSDAEGGTP